MTAATPPAPVDGPALAATAVTDSATQTAPVIVLTYAHAGVELLTQALAASRSLAFTSTTGVLPLCHEAVSAWQIAEGRDGPPSALAIKSVRALATTMITVIQARAGARRWCETAFANSAAAGTFLQVFPAATFLCLHRSLRGVFHEAARAYPWGLGGSPFWAYAAGHPGNNVATIASYWVDRTQALLDFELQHPESCLRIRYEDLAARRDSKAKEILGALGLGNSEVAVLREPPPEAAEEDQPETVAPVPSDRIPPHLVPRMRDLLATLRYDHPLE